MAKVGRPRKPVESISTGRTLLDLEDASRRLSLSAWTLRKWAYAGKIASHKVGSKLMIADAEVERIIAESERPRVGERLG